MDLNSQKDHFSRAIVRAIAATAGVKATVPEHDEDSQDMTFAAADSDTAPGVRLDAQLKCSQNINPSASRSVSLPVKNYNDLRWPVLYVPRILIVVHVPPDPAEWLVTEPEQTTLKRARTGSVSPEQSRREHVHGQRQHPNGTSVRSRRTPCLPRATRSRAMSEPEARLSSYLDPRQMRFSDGARLAVTKAHADVLDVGGTGRCDARAAVPAVVPCPQDFEERLQEFVSALARIQDEDRDALVTNLRYATADLVRVRLVGTVGRGELPIGDGADLFEGAREMMLAAACATVSTRPNFGPRKPRQALDYLDQVRLGQTERGSYVVTVISDVAPPEQQHLVPDDAAVIDVPFERHVTTKLVGALSAAHGAATSILTQQSGYGAFDEAVEAGVSANLCDAIVTMGAEQAAAHVEVSMEWASSRPPAPGVPSSVAFEAASLPVIKQAVAHLRELARSMMSW